MKQTILDDIKTKALPILQLADVKRASLFGSYVRGDNTEESDIDILVDLPRGKTLLDLVGIKQDLEEKLKKPVDIMTYNSIHPLLKDSILSNQYQIL
ncbi:MAG TPA: nucleotidyltransferase family protein [Candidatus Saccharimonadales bacterium]|nr:nucleotidyltransferase family protein [Candidatus Saccharimonadales bacterium]